MIRRIIAHPGRRRRPRPGPRPRASSWPPPACEVDWDEHLAGLAAMRAGAAAAAAGDARSGPRRGRRAQDQAPRSAPKAQETNFNVQLRRALGLFASVRPLKNLPGLPARFQRRRHPASSARSPRTCTPPSSTRSSPAWCRASRSSPRRPAGGSSASPSTWPARGAASTIHCVHKANILKLADGLFLECFRRIARRLPRPSRRAR